MLATLPHDLSISAVAPARCAPNVASLHYHGAMVSTAHATQDANAIPSNTFSRTLARTGAHALFSHSAPRTNHITLLRQKKDTHAQWFALWKRMGNPCATPSHDTRPIFMHPLLPEPRPPRTTAPHPNNPPATINDHIECASHRNKHLATPHSAEPLVHPICQRVFHGCVSG